MRGEFIGQFLTRLDGFHGLIRVDLAGVEVDGVGHGALVFDGDFEFIAHFSAQGRAWGLAVEEPTHLLDAGGDLYDFFGHRPGLFVGLRFGGRLHRGVEGRKAIALGAEFGGGGHVYVGVACRSHRVIMPCGGAISDVDLKSHALHLVAGDGAIAFLGGVDDSGIKLDGLAGIDAAGLGITYLQVMDLVTRVGEVDHQMGSRVDIDRRGRKGHAIHTNVNGLRFTRGYRRSGLRALASGIDHRECDNCR